MTNVEIQNAQIQKQVLHLALCLLPKANRDLLEVLLLFFKELGEFAMRKDGTNGSLMDISNIATVIAPNILYNKQQQTIIKEESILAINTVTALLIWQDDYWLVPIEITSLMNESTDGMTEKDMLKKCEVVLKNNMPMQQQATRKEINNVENKLVIYNEDDHVDNKHNSSATISDVGTSTDTGK